MAKVAEPPWAHFRRCEVALLHHHPRSGRHGSGAWATGCFQNHASIVTPPTTLVFGKELDLVSEERAEPMSGMVRANYPRMPRMQEATTEFVYIRWLGNRREFPEGHTHLKKDRDDDLLWWSDLVDRFLQEGRTVFAYANNHYQNHSPSTVERFLELRRGDR
jgi:uncharacterized protein YecE (DUF72 family)